MKNSRNFPWLRILVHVAGVFPLAMIVYSAASGILSVNPIQDVEQRLGRAAFNFLAATLAVTPIYILTGWRAILPHRRTLGLYAFLYATLHFIVFAGLDYRFDIREIGRQILVKPFILLGITGGLILMLLAATSFDHFKRMLGTGWKSLHRLIYVAGPIVIIHYALAKKGNLFTLSGDILKPFLLGLLITFLLIMRIPAVRKFTINSRQRITRFFLQKKEPDK